MLYQELSKKIIGAFFEIHNALGPGLLEKNYHNSLFLKLKKYGFNVKYQYPLNVYFEGDQVGEYYADLLVENKIIIEVKAVTGFTNEHRAQILNYLHISKCRLGFLVNFYPTRCTFERLVL